MRQRHQAWQRWGPAVAAAVAGVSLLSAPARAVGLFDIHLNPGPGLQANPAALAAFERAAQDWETRISSPIRVNIDADLVGLGSPTTIGQTNLFVEDFNPNKPYTQVRDAMAARSARPGNAILAFLPTTAFVKAIVPDGRAFDATTLGLVRANQKALGIIPNGGVDTAVDAEITFNSNFAFAYDRATLNGSNVDFQTVVTHELGHALGFISDVDDFDNNTDLPSDNLTTLDLFRFNAGAVPTTPQQFRDLARELRPGEDSVTSDASVRYPMSTGANFGDGHQASHWQDDFAFIGPGVFITRPLIGVMDPTLDNGTVEEISAADLRAFELIGYDTVPEPGTAGVFVIVVGGLLFRRRLRATSERGN